MFSKATFPNLYIKIHYHYHKITFEEHEDYIFAQIHRRSKDCAGTMYTIKT